MHRRVITVHKDHRGCTLLDDGRPLACYPTLAPALEMARTLVAASQLRDDRVVVVQLSRPGEPPRPLVLD